MSGESGNFESVKGDWTDLELVSKGASCFTFLLCGWDYCVLQISILGLCLALHLGSYGFLQESKKEEKRYQVMAAQTSTIF